jgi:hypothetical protein
MQDLALTSLMQLRAFQLTRQTNRSAEILGFLALQLAEDSSILSSQPYVHFTYRTLGNARLVPSFKL